MGKILDIPVEAVVALTPERAVEVVRTMLRSECGYAKLNPNALTISQRISIPDGGIDAEINVPEDVPVPSDCIFGPGVTGFQLKTGINFKPWMRSAIRNELEKTGRLASAVANLITRHGGYTLLCTGHDLTPRQRNDARREIVRTIEKAGFEIHEDVIQVLGASQIAEVAGRYPKTAALLTIDPIQEALVLEEWERDVHMGTAFEASDEQSMVISQIREAINGECAHVRILGEPGLGKTRIALEAAKDESIAPYVLYFQHGAEFGRTKLFRQLLRTGHDKPLVLVIDELPESSLPEIWSHLKSRCGRMKLLTMDHGQDVTRDEDILRLEAPRLSNETIKRVLPRLSGRFQEG